MSENIGRYNVILNYEVEKEKLREGTNNVKRELSGMEAAFAKARTAFAGIIAVGGLQQLGSQIFEVTKKYQQYETILRVALGSQTKAQKALQLIQDTAKSTIFSVDELTSSYIKFVNRGINPTAAEITKIADLAASQGKSFDQLTEAILDAQTGEFERLKEFGIIARSEGNKVALSFREKNQVIEKTPEAINAAIIAMGALNGIAGSNAEQMGNLSGVMSNLGDMVDQIFLKIGNALLPVFEFLLNSLVNLASGIETFVDVLIGLPKFVKENATQLKLLGLAIISFNLPLIMSTTAILANIVATKAKAVADLFLANKVGILTRAQWLLNAAFLANPVGVIVAGVLALAAGMISLYKNSETVRNIFAGLANIAAKTVDAFKNLAKEVRDIFGKGFINGFKTIGTGIVDGIKQSVTEAFSDFENIVKGEDIAKSATRLLRKVLNLLTFGLSDTFFDLGQKALSAFNDGFEDNKQKERRNIPKGGRDPKKFAEIQAQATTPPKKTNDDKKNNKEKERVLTEIEKLKEEQSKLEAKLQNDLLKDLPIDTKAVNRIKEITNILSDLELVVNRLTSNDTIKTDSIVPKITKTQLVSIGNAKNEIQAITTALEQLKKAGVISKQTFDNLNIFENAFNFEGGLTPEKQKEINDKMQAALNESLAKTRGEFNTADIEVGNQQPFFQQLFGFSDEQFSQFKSALKTAEQAAKETLQAIFDQEMAINEQRISAQDERVQAALKAAEKGKVEQLKIEEERLSELKKKQQSFANAQRAIASFQIATSSAVAVAEGIKAVATAFGTNGPAAIPLGIATSLALAAQIAAIGASIRGAFSGLALKDGIEQVKGPGTTRSDSIPARLSKNERVVDAATNQKIGFDFKNKDLPKAVDFYKKHKDSALLFANKPFYPQFQRVQFSQNKGTDKQVARRLEAIENTLKGMSVNVNIDSEGLAVEVLKKFEYYETRKKYIG